MEREFSAPLHRKMNPEVQNLVDSGMSIRTAYRMVARAKADNKAKQEFDYDRETPKGEWV